MAIRVNLRSSDRGGTLIKHLDTERTEVYHGNLHSRVWFKDVGIEIELDSQPGEWRDELWARNYAFQALSKKLTPAILKRIIDTSTRTGFDDGVLHQQQVILNSLGIK